MRKQQAVNLIEYVKKNHDNSSHIVVETKVSAFDDEIVECFSYYSNHYEIGHIQAVTFTSLARLVIATYEAKGMFK